MSATDETGKEPMKYALLGKDTSTNEDKLAKFTGQVNWSYLRPHYLSGVLIFVDPSLTLKHVGSVIALDDIERVTQWIKSGDLVKIGSLHAAQWEETATEFEALVVSPFVLCRPLEPKFEGS